MGPCRDRAAPGSQPERELVAGLTYPALHHTLPSAFSSYYVLPSLRFMFCYMDLTSHPHRHELYLSFMAHLCIICSTIIITK